MSELGTLDVVRVVKFGSFLTGDTSAGATTLAVDDLADFSEDGGWLIVNDQAIQYTSGDDESGVMVLAEALADDASEGDRVDVLVNGGVASVMVAHVYLGDADDPRDRFPVVGWGD